MQTADEEITEYVEGKTRILVPKSSLVKEASVKNPAFYNPFARLGRDVAVCVVSAFARKLSHPIHFLDALAGVGVRALRILVEGEGVDRCIINDANPSALELAQRSAQLNGVADRCQFTNLEATSLLVTRPSLKRRFSLIDIDPFGSPASFFEAALRGVENGGMAAFTATDTAALCGVYPDVALRRYHGASIRVEEAKEIGIRLILGGVAFAAMRLEAGITPLMSHATRHYMRIYCILELGARKASQNLKHIGHYIHCKNCLARYATKEPERLCTNCGNVVLRAGPLWVGPIASIEFLHEILEFARRQTYREASRLLEMVAIESDLPPGYYTIDSICSKLRLSTPPRDKVLMMLTQMGYRAARTHMDPVGLKTDAPPKVLKSVLQSIR